MDDNGLRRQQQRNFYLYLSPIDGHEIAEEEGGFTSPSEEAMEAEIRDVLTHWLTLQQGDAGEIIANCAWWMTQYMDPEKRLAASEGVVYLDRLTSFIVSALALLLEQGVIDLKQRPELPDIRLSSEVLFDGNSLDILSYLQSLLEEDDDE
jgi:hypothetical protein